MALASFLLVGYELLWRARGFSPTLVDNESLWCRARAMTARDGVVIVGSSRLQAGLDPAIMSRGLGRSVTQLALAGSNPIPVLFDLAHDSSFRGLIVLEYMPRRFFTPDASSVSRAERFLASCRDPSLVAAIEASMGRALQRRFVSLLPDLNAISVLSYVARKRALPSGMHQMVREDRFTPIHAGAVESQATGASGYWDQPLTETALDARTAPLRAAIAELRARGGDVILYRSPVSGAVLADEESRFPVAAWLPRLGAALGVRAIDFAAVPALRNIVCPDGEHTEATDVPRITEALTTLLR